MDYSIRVCRFALASFAACLIAGRADAQNYAFVRALTGSGTAVGSLKAPSGIAIGNNGAIVVADTGNDRIVAFDANGNEVLLFGTSGAGAGQFSHPASVAVDKAGAFYVANTYNFRIEKFDAAGKFLLQFGSYGAGAGQLGAAYSVAASVTGPVYVADAAYSRIEQYDATGAFLSQFGAGGQSAGRFYAPYGLAADAAGALFVADTYNNRIQKFNGSVQALQITAFNGSDGFNLPRGVSVDAAKNIFGADTGNNRVVKFDSDGNYETAFGPANGVGKLSAPNALAIDGRGNVWIADTSDNRIAQFAPAAASVSGILNFQGIATNAPAQNVAFTFRSNDGSADIVQTLAVTASGVYTLTGLFNKAGVLHIKPYKYLAANVSLDLSGGNLSGQNATLEPGDANNDNSVDSTDFGILIGAFNTQASIPGSGYDATADFNGDGFVDSTDFGLLIGSFNMQGNP